MGIRFGQMGVSLGGNTVASLHALADGTHVDLARGVMPFNAPAGALVEANSEGALLRAKCARAKQTEVKILGPKVLQVGPRRGDLEFFDGNDQRVLPEGQTYRIHLDVPEASGLGKHPEPKRPEFRLKVCISLWRPPARVWPRGVFTLP